MSRSSVVDLDRRRRGRRTGVARRRLVHDPRGEIVGIAGVEGNGQTELVEAIIGVVDGAIGRIELFGEDITERIDT